MAVLEEVGARAAVRPRMTARQRMVLVLLLGAQFMLAVDFSILNVALPAVGDGLGFCSSPPPSSAAWATCWRSWPSW